MLPGRIDENGIFTAFDELSIVVLAVPDDLVLAGGSSRTGDCENQVRLVDLLPSLVGAVPAFQVGEPLKRPGSAHREPECQGTNREAVLVFDPNSHIRPAVASTR